MKIKILFIVVFSLILRLLHISPWLEDWDSVQFALALNNYSIVLHQPHAPGYPLYILMVKFLNIFINNPTLSLTYLSTFLGSIIIIPIYLLSKKMFNSTIAFFASLFFMASPVSWTLSEVALTNMPGQFFLILIIYLLFIFSKNKKVIILLSGLFGLMLGIRFTEFPIIVSLLTFVIFFHKSPKLALHSFLSFIIGVSSWLIPLILVTGFREFVDSYEWIANYIFKHDTLLGQSFSIKALLSQRLEKLIFITKIGFTPLFSMLSIFSLVWIFAFREYLRNSKIQFLLVWLISYLIPLILVYNLEVPRYILPLLAPLTILNTVFILNILKSKMLIYIILLLTFFILFNQSFDQVTRFKNTTPPVVTAVKFVKENYSPQDTLVVATLTYRHFQYYAPQFETIYGEKDLEKINLNNKVIIVDYAGTKNNAIFKKYRVDKETTFNEDKDIFTRVNKITLYILKKN